MLSYKILPVTLLTYLQKSAKSILISINLQNFSLKHYINFSLD